MKVWEIQNAYGIENLRESEEPEPKAGAGEIVVAVKAASL
jgi:NADPH:quinone reductase-like Zn-dependent oxidoreductase